MESAAVESVLSTRTNHERREPNRFPIGTASITYFFCCDTVKVCPAIVSVPMRAPSAFAATVKVAIPLPLRNEPSMVIHGTLLTAVHVQPDVVVTFTGPPSPPELSIVWLAGAMAYLHSACVTVMVWPAAISVPVRAGPVLFGAMLYVKVPSPVPLPPLTTIQDAPLLADHWQPVAVVTEMGAELTPEAVVEMLCCDSVYVHPTCATVTVFPATVSVPVRARLVFAGTLNLTLPLSLPLAPDTIEIQVALLVAVQLQPGADTVMDELVTPVMGTETLVGFTEVAQPACVTVTLWPEMESVPVRAAPGLDATLNEILTLPVPLFAPVMEIHNALLLADQPHPAGAVNETEFEFEPEAGAETLCGATV